jgi:uncharacterized coiled-coil DUF342 family protein
MADDPSAEARRAAVHEAAQRASELRSHSADLIEFARELRARVGELKRQLAPGDGPVRTED